MSQPWFLPSRDFLSGGSKTEPGNNAWWNVSNRVREVNAALCAVSSECDCTWVGVERSGEGGLGQRIGWQLSGPCLQQGSGRHGTGNEIFLFLFLARWKRFESGWRGADELKMGTSFSWVLISWWIINTLLLDVDRSGRVCFYGLSEICIWILEFLL